MKGISAYISVMNSYSKRLAQIGVQMTLLFLLIACVAYTTIRQHPDFKGRIAKTKTVMILTPDVEIIRGSSIDTGIQLPEEAKQLTGDLSLHLGVELSHYGFEVKGRQVQNPISHDLTDSQAQTITIKRMYEQLRIAMYRGAMTEPDAKAYRYNLGSEAIALAKQAQTDSLIFARLRVFERPGADIAAEMGKNVLIGMMTLGVVVLPKDPSGWAELQVTLVDGTTGDVMWGNLTSEVSNTLMGEPNFRGALKNMVANVFKPFSK